MGVSGVVDCYPSTWHLRFLSDISLCSSDGIPPIQMTRIMLPIYQKGLNLLTAFVENLFGVDHYYSL